MKPRFLFTMASALLLAFWVSHSDGQEVKKTKMSNKEIRTLLNKTVDTKGLQEPIKLGRVLEFLSDKLGGKVVFQFDKASLAAAFDAGDPDPRDDNVKLDVTKKQLTAKAVLSQALTQVARGKWTYVVRQGSVEITTNANTASSVEEIELILTTPIGTVDLQKSTKLEDFLEIVTDALADKGKLVVIKIDTASFMAENPKAADIRARQIKLKTGPKQLPASAILAQTTAQVSPNAIFVIREGYVELTTKAKAKFK